jgi:hypothetical protein
MRYRNMISASTAGLALALGLGACGSSSGYKPSNPPGVRACISAWLKLHDDGVTAAVMAHPKTIASIEVLAAVPPADVSATDACVTISHADDTYATAQINAQTGDHYKPGH